MWKRAGRSAALDRAQALLLARKSATEAKAQGCLAPKAADPNIRTPESDLSDLSSVSLSSELGSVAKNHRRGVASSKFIKKVAGKSQLNPSSGHPPVDTSLLPSSHHNTGQGSPSGQPDVHLSPTAHTPSPTPYEPSDRRHSPQSTTSSVSGCGVRSPNSLDTVGPVSESQQSDLDTFSSGDFKINVMSLDDLIPVPPEMTAEPVVKEEGEGTHSPAVPSLDTMMHVTKPEVEYPSDFESDPSTEPPLSTRGTFEQSIDGVEEEMVTNVGEEEDDKGTREEHSNHFSQVSDLRASDQSCKSKVHSRSRKSRSVSNSSRSSSQSVSKMDEHCRASRTVRDAAVQTQREALGDSWLSGQHALNITPVGEDTVGACKVEAISSFNPAASFVNEMLRQQLDIIRERIEMNRHLHVKLLQSLEPPTHRYTTLKNTKELTRTRHFQTGCGGS